MASFHFCIDVDHDDMMMTKWISKPSLLQRLEGDRCLPKESQLTTCNCFFFSGSIPFVLKQQLNFTSNIAISLHELNLFIDIYI